MLFEKSTFFYPFYFSISLQVLDKKKVQQTNKQKMKKKRNEKSRKLSNHKRT